MSILIYADGACRRNPGPGGWGLIIYDLDTKRIFELGGSADHTTNNRMELEAVLNALKAIENIPGSVTFYLDSTYVIQSVMERVPKWSKNSWFGTDDIKNKDILQNIYTYVLAREKTSTLSWKHVLGHAGIPGNERADEIAQAFADKKPIALFNNEASQYSIDLVNIPPPQISKQKSSKNRSGKAAYIYLSFVDGVLERHKTWDECNKRVHGVAKAKFKKALSPEEEKEILREWGLL